MRALRSHGRTPICQPQPQQSVQRSVARAQPQSQPQPQPQQQQQADADMDGWFLRHGLVAANRRLQQARDLWDIVLRAERNPRLMAAGIASLERFAVEENLCFQGALLQHASDDDPLPQRTSPVVLELQLHAACAAQRLFVHEWVSQPEQQLADQPQQRQQEGCPQLARIIGNLEQQLMMLQRQRRLEPDRLQRLWDQLRAPELRRQLFFFFFFFFGRNALHETLTRQRDKRDKPRPSRDKGTEETGGQRQTSVRTKRSSAAGGACRNCCGDCP